MRGTHRWKLNSLHIWNNWSYMKAQPPKMHNHGKYDNSGKGWYFRFDDDDEMSLYLRIRKIFHRQVKQLRLSMKPRATLNSLRPRQNGCHFADEIFKWIFLNENVWISINISLKFVPRGPINNIPTLVQVMVWRPPGDKPLSEPMLVRLPTHICVTRSQWVNWTCNKKLSTSR